jgi:hypothetical protein
MVRAVREAMRQRLSASAHRFCIRRSLPWDPAVDDRQANFPAIRTDDELGRASLLMTDGNAQASPSDGCGTPIFGVVFMRSSSETIREHSTPDGKAVRPFDTTRSFDMVNAVQAKGANIHAAGQ